MQRFIAHSAVCFRAQLVMRYSNRLFHHRYINLTIDILHGELVFSVSRMEAVMSNVYFGKQRATALDP
jgi:hypothetical protein